MLEKHLQDTERLRWKLDSGAVVEQFLSRQGNVKSSKLTTSDLRGVVGKI